MAKRTDQELDDHIKDIFEDKRWSPLSAQDILSQNEDYDPPDDGDMLASVGRLTASGDMLLVLERENEMQSVYETTSDGPTN